MEDRKSQMTWGEFRNTLEQHSGLLLQFEYEPGKTVANSYHITEFKQAPIVSVDCGGKVNNWSEIIVQLWEPFDLVAEKPMLVSKALKIIGVVESSVSLNPVAIVRIEFGSADFPAQQMYPVEFVLEPDTLRVVLTPDFTQCKAQSRNECCGTTATTAACCMPA